MSDQPHRGGISLKDFTLASHGSESAAYISALEKFDQIAQLQELKALGRERTGIGPAARVLDVGWASAWRRCAWLAWQVLVVLCRDAT